MRNHQKAMDAIAPNHKTPAWKPGKFARRTLQTAPTPGHLRITKLSGEHLAETQTNRHRRVKDLLAYLEPYCNVSRQRIRVLQHTRRLPHRNLRQLRLRITKDMQAVILPYVHLLEGSKEKEDFRLALWNRHAKKLATLLWRPIDPNTIFNRYYPSPTSALELLLLNPTASWPAAALRHILEAKAALDRPENKDVLLLAVRQGQAHYVQLLLRQQANPRGSTNRLTPLDMACQHHPEDFSHNAQQPGLITMLLTAQADPEPMLRDANSWAAHPTPRDYVDLANPRTLNSTVTLACAAAAHSNPTFMQHILAAATTEQTATITGDLPCKAAQTSAIAASLCSAAYAGKTNHVRWLLGMKANPDAHVCHRILQGKHDFMSSGHDHQTAVALAAAKGHYATVQTLLEAKADANLSFNGNNTVVAQLLMARADPNFYGFPAEPPLVLACLQNKPDTAELLLHAKANLEENLLRAMFHYEIAQALKHECAQDLLLRQAQRRKRSSWSPGRFARQMRRKASVQSTEPPHQTQRSKQSADSHRPAPKHGQRDKTRRRTETSY
ncbi:anks1b [Symbiodinium sp. CCMP2592]|nr:anks1b [Symbiodinium sp. CCMP2592]